MNGAHVSDPFAALGLPARPGLSDDDVRSAWRRIAAATHPDRADGGDPARFAEAAAAYTVLRTRFGRGEALADLQAHQDAGLLGCPDADARGHPQTGRQGPEETGAASQAPPSAAVRWASPWPLRGRRLASWWPGRRPARWPAAPVAVMARAWHGRPARLGLRVVVVAAVSILAVLADGWHPASPAVITGALTWLAVTGRHDLAPPGSGDAGPRSHP